MNTNRDSDLSAHSRSQECISEEFHNDPELLVKHYIELQERHRDRLVRSVDAGAENLRKGPSDWNRTQVELTTAWPQWRVWNLG